MDNEIALRPRAGVELRDVELGLSQEVRDRARLHGVLFLPFEWLPAGADADAHADRVMDRLLDQLAERGQVRGTVLPVTVYGPDELRESAPAAVASGSWPRELADRFQCVLTASGDAVFVARHDRAAGSM
ncbi:hypothetical protein [Streptacidiphilus cavernicola]|uniref:Uncharacterized protein n=1 Tax=Streptacidiphilus cavernicola TaxID=3342716 RepID=A0ABV6VY53_9ACTN